MMKRKLLLSVFLSCPLAMADGTSAILNNCSTPSSPVLAMREAKANLTAAQARLNTARIAVKKRKAQWQHDGERYHRIKDLGGNVSGRILAEAKLAVEMGAVDVEFLLSQVDEAVAAVELAQIKLDGLQTEASL